MSHVTVTRWYASVIEFGERTVGWAVVQLLWLLPTTRDLAEAVQELLGLSSAQSLPPAYLLSIILCLCASFGVDNP